MVLISKRSKQRLTEELANLDNRSKLGADERAVPWNTELSCNTLFEERRQINHFVDISTDKAR
ncbi:MAG: hypothetical protein IID44_15530 [Planctomycetes bacterium]|nr:hypothetical protein [Planctomycetota bacterium]